MLDEGLLQHGKLAVLGVAFDRADGFAVETRRRNDAGRAGVARPVGIIDDHRAAQALRGAAAELGAGHPEIFAQEIVHRQIVAHVHRAVGATIDGESQCRHVERSLEHGLGHRQGLEAATGGIEDGVQQRGNDGNHHDFRDAFRRLVRLHAEAAPRPRNCLSGRSDARATRYCPRFHFPLPGPSS